MSSAWYQCRAGTSRVRALAMRASLPTARLRHRRKNSCTCARTRCSVSSLSETTLKRTDGLTQLHRLKVSSASTHGFADAPRWSWTSCGADGARKRTARPCHAEQLRGRPLGSAACAHSRLLNGNDAAFSYASTVAAPRVARGALDGRLRREIALLRDDAHLLRQRRAAHRPCVHVAHLRCRRALQAAGRRSASPAR